MVSSPSGPPCQGWGLAQGLLRGGSLAAGQAHWGPGKHRPKNCWQPGSSHYSPPGSWHWKPPAAVTIFSLGALLWG